MDEPTVTRERIAIWMSMADHYLDTDTRDGIPETARLCVEAGLTVEQARDIWCHEVSPVVSFNLYLVAGEWAGWDEAWLVERIQALRARPRGRVRRFLDRSALWNETWRAIESRMQDSLETASSTMITLPVALPDHIVAALHRAYEQPPRAYHNFDHVLEVIGHFERVPDWLDRDAVCLAILFHDAIYVAGRTDNETKSAELAATSLAPTRYAPLIARVQQLILLTARHGSIDPAEVDHDAALFLDCDMAILGASPDTYATYERAIAEEYAAVPPIAYRAGRARFLHKLLARPRIYLSDLFHDEREPIARANIQRALDQLAQA